MHLRIDRFTIDSHEMVGERLRVDGYLSRTGVQNYSQGDGTIQREQRDATEVFNPDALHSFRAMPVTVGHPRFQMVDGENWRDLSHGHVGDDVREAEDGVHTRASVWVLDAATQRRVISGELTELSCGYFAELDETPGRNDAGEDYDVRQINMRGNHLALLHDNEARGGRGCRLRLDSQGNAELYSDNGVEPNDTKPPATPGNQRSELMKLKIKADGYEHAVEAEDDKLVVALDKERATYQAKIDAADQRAIDAEKLVEGEKARADAAEQAKVEAEERLAAATDPKAMADSVAAVTKLHTDARLVADKDIELEGDELTIKRAALEARGVDITDRSDAYIDARFDIELELAIEKNKRVDPVSNARQAIVDKREENARDDRHEPLNLTGTLRERLSDRKEAN